MLSPRSPTIALLALALAYTSLLTANKAQATPALGDPAPYTVAAPRAPERLPAPARRPRYVLLISVDGLSYGAFRHHRRSLPYLSMLARRGTYRPMTTAFPSMTWAAHTSLSTGQLPRHHGILGNRWLDADGRYRRPYRESNVAPRRAKRVPSIFELARASGLSVAALNWPGSQGEKAIRWNLPEMFGVRKSYRLLSADMRGLFRRYAKRLGRSGRRTKYWRNLVNSIAQREAADYDLLLRDLAVELIRPHHTRSKMRRARHTTKTWRARRSSKTHEAPRVLFVHFLLPDSWLHRYGTSRLHERWSLELTDNAIGRIIRAYRRQKIWDQTTTFVVSDHGFTEITHTMDLRRLLKARGYAKYRTLNDRRAKTETFASVLNGHAALLYPRTPGQARRLPELVKLLHEYPKCIESVFAPRAYQRLGLPVPPTGPGGKEAGPNEYGGAPALIALSHPHCIFKGRGRRANTVYKLRNGLIGYHGYLPRHPALQAIMITSGVGIRQAKLPLSRASITDIAPTMAHLLGLSWPKHFPSHPTKQFTLDGRILKDALR